LISAVKKILSFTLYLLAVARIFIVGIASSVALINADALATIPRLLMTTSVNWYVVPGVSTLDPICFVAPLLPPELTELGHELPNVGEYSAQLHKYDKILESVG
jgi:hypothetical protein